ncbi:hypothetical protein GCM10007860_25160 [Chitiniphilus shinanonensis]|uniref:Phytase-like domain-containing protein n=2 Tax=Chitiniphilus shinanonensis TaxID=553088 RepID=A0ABQ6C059_9NEIS|nr:hypothetical protein GCM10007860_25160 [Chitiniphilus shinanonensis]
MVMALIHRCLVVLVGGFFGFAAQAGSELSSHVKSEYFHINDPSETGLGFLADTNLLYVGGCRVFELKKREFGKTCLYPADLRWAAVSPDGSLLLGSAAPVDGGKGTSYQLDAVTGRVLSSRRGLYFAPPIAISPTNKYWVGSFAAANAIGSEHLGLMGRDWRIKKQNIDAGVQRIFRLDFSENGEHLWVNGHGSTSARLDTVNWEVSSDIDACDACGNLAFVDQKAGIGVRFIQKKAIIKSLEDGRALFEVDIDSSRAEPEVAISKDGKLLAIKGNFEKDGKVNYGFVLVDLKSLVR